MQVGRRAAFARIDDQQHAIGLLDGLEGLLGHQALDAVDGFGKPAGIHDHAAAGAGARVTVLAVAGQSRDVGDQRVARAREHVEQRGFADIGTPDERDDG